MTGHSGGSTRDLRERLLKDQARRAERERKLSFAKKLRILDQMMQEGAPEFEDVTGPCPERNPDPKHD